MPGLVVVNGHGDDKYSPYTFYASVLYTRAGAVSLTYDPTGEGERNGDRKGGAWQHDRNLEPEDFGRRMGGLMLAKIIQATSYLPQRSHVDSKRSRPWAIRRAVSCSALPVTVETQLHAYVLAGAAIWMENVPRDSLINRSGF